MTEASASADRAAARANTRSVVQLTLWNSPYLGNFMSSELALAARVRAQFGLKTHFVLAHGADRRPWLADLRAAGVSWSTLPRKRREWSAHIERVVHERSAALIHTHFTAADLIAARIASEAGIPCVWHIRTGFNRYSLRRRIQDLYKMRFVARRRVARIITVSPWLTKFAARRGAPRDRIETVPNAIVLERFERLPARAVARERLNVDVDAEVVLGLGWWPEVKGVDVLLDATQLIAEKRSAPSVLLVGEEQMRSFLDQRSPARPPWLHVAGFVSDPAWLFAAADIFVS